MNQLIDLFSKKSRGPGRRRRHPQSDRFTLESLESRALLAVMLPPSISGGTVEIDDNLIVANGGWNVTATGGHVQIFGNSRGRIDGTPGDLNEDLTINANTFITVTGAIGATDRIDDLTLTSTNAEPVNLQQAVYITGSLRVTNAGSFTMGSTVDVDRNLTIDAATNVMFSGNVNVDGDLTITNASSIIFAGTLRVGGQLTITNVTGSTRFSGDVIVGAAAITSTTLVQVQANFASTGGVGAGDGDVTITTDQVSFSSGTIQSSALSSGSPSATLTVKPKTPSRDLTIGSPPGIPSGVNITDADLFAIQPGWKRVVFGDEAAGTGAVRIGSIGSQYGGFSQILNTTTIVGGTVQVVQPVDVTDLADYLELIARGTGAPGSGAVTINAAINQTADERNNWVRITSVGSITLNAPVWSDQTVSLTTTSGGTIAQGGSSAAITTHGLAVDADGSVTLADSDNAVVLLATRTTNDSLVFREDSGYSISQITTTDSARDVQQIATVTGIDAGSATVRLVTISGQTPSTVGQFQPIIANGLGLEGSNTDWALTLPTNDVGTLGGFTGSINFHDVDDLTIDTVAAVSPRSSLAGITVARTLSVTTGTTLTITAAGDIASAASSGTAVTLTAPSGISTAGAIETSGANATFNNATTLTGDVVVDLENGPARGTMLFMSTVQGTTSGQESLTIGGNLDAHGSIGSATALESLSVSGDSTFTGGITLRTTGNQTYFGAATSSGTITIQAGQRPTVYSQPYAYTPSQNGAISDLYSNQIIADNFVTNSGLPATGLEWYGYYGLTNPFPTGGTANFVVAFYQSAGGVGGPQIPPLFATGVAAAIEPQGGAVSVSGGTMYRFAATLPSAISFTPGTQYWVALTATDPPLFGQNFTWATAQTGLDGYAWSGNGGISFAAGSDGSGAGVNGRNYEAFTLFAPDTTPLGAGPTVSFLGDTTLGGLVTATADTANYNVVLTGTSVSVTNVMTFANTGSVTLGNEATDNLLFVNGLTSTAPTTTNLAGTIGTTNANATFGLQPGGAVVVTADAIVSTGAGAAAFHGTVDAATSGGSALTVNATGTTTFAQAVGGTRALKSLATNAGGSTRINGGGVTTSGVDGQAYGDAVVIDTSDVILAAGAGPVTFTSTIDSAVAGLVALTVNTTGGTTFGGAVGGSGALKSLTTNAGGTTKINGGSVTTSGTDGQVYGDAIEIGVNDATLAAGIGLVTFNGTVDAATSGGFALTVTASGLTSFNAAVGTTALKSLATNGGGTTAINGLSIRTSDSAGQVFSDAVSLGNNTTLDAAAGAINFESTLDGAYTLAVNTTGTTTFGNVVGFTDRLVSLTTNAGGLTAINGGSIKTSGANGQAFQDAVALGNDTTLEAAAGIITFANTVDSGVVAARSLAVNTQGETWFAGDVGSTRPLASLTTDTGNVTRITADVVKTSGSQTYNDRVTFEEPLAPTSISTLSVPETLMTGSTVSLLQGLDAAGRSLRIEGNAVFGDQPGSPLVTIIPDTFVDPVLGLNGLTVTGSTVINSNAVASGFTAPTNPITFQGPVTLGSSGSIVGAGVRFQSTVAGPGRSFQVGSLAFGGSSSIVFDGDVGTLAAPLGPIDLACLDGSVVINAAIHSTGPVTIKALSIDGDADNAIRVPTSTISLTTVTGIGATTPIAVQAASVTASTWTGGIRLRGIGDLTVGTPGLIADSSGIDLTASGQIRVPGGNTIRAANGVTTNTPIRWGLLGTADSGSGSLRDVIAKANATGAAGIIEFGSGQSTFVLQSPLPEITTRLAINGTIGGGSVVLDGNSGVASGLVFTAQAAGSSLSNVLIRNFTGFGVQLVGAQNMAVDNISVRSLNTSTSMGLFATGNLAGTTITGSVFSGGLRGALLDNARNLTFGQIGRGNTLANNISAPNDPRFSGTGIRAQGNCQGTVVTGNTFTNNNLGFGFVNAQNLTLRQNTFSRNRVTAIYVEGNCLGSVQTGNSFATAKPDRNGRIIMRFPRSRGV